MKIFLSAIETNPEVPKLLVDDGVRMKYNLMSYYYVSGEKRWSTACFIRDNTDEIMIDSGAHSFQKGAKVKWDEYTAQYAEFIRRFDRPNVVGYFEMDVDNVLGYDKVLQLRAVLERASDKIIPVWHKNRGINEFKKMCQQYSGRVVAITGFKNEDIKDNQYIMFLKYAREHNCKVHCLGMTRKAILDRVPFDYTDSSSWKQGTIYGRIEGQPKNRKPTKQTSKDHSAELMAMSYKAAMKNQEHYYMKWRKVCND